MKKLTIILISIFFTTSVQALVFEKCYKIKDSRGKSVQTKFDSDRLEKYQYEIFPKEGKVRRVLIYSKKGVKQQQEYYDKEGASFLKAQKIYTLVYDLKYIDENYLEAVHQETNKNITFINNLNLDKKNGEVIENIVNKNYSDEFVNYTTTKKCNVAGLSSKSSYLDYWWAVILIIAITFFIFTQSGKRLKKIRRK